MKCADSPWGCPGAGGKIYLKLEKKEKENCSKKRPAKLHGKGSTIAIEVWGKKSAKGKNRKGSAI